MEFSQEIWKVEAKIRDAQSRKISTSSVSSQSQKRNFWLTFFAEDLRSGVACITNADGNRTRNADLEWFVVGWFSFNRSLKKVPQRTRILNRCFFCFVVIFKLIYLSSRGVLIQEKITQVILHFSFNEHISCAVKVLLALFLGITSRSNSKVWSPGDVKFSCFSCPGTSCSTPAWFIPDEEFSCCCCQNGRKKCWIGWLFLKPVTSLAS